ncbi:MAG: hypothetical protein WD795_21405 [Woeseia sp.]
MAQHRSHSLWPIAALTTAALLGAACNGEIYLRDGVTDGDTFYLAERALTDPDPVLQSWVSYSLTRSACQLQAGGENPARANSFECELGAREHLVETWSEHRAAHANISDRYLDELTQVQEAGFLAEYVADNFRRRNWQIPPRLDPRAFDDWRRIHLRSHTPATRLIGSWNYARKVNSASH